MRLGHILIVCRPEQPPVVPTVIGHRQASVFAILPHELGVQQLDPPVTAKPPQALQPGSSVVLPLLQQGDAASMQRSSTLQRPTAMQLGQ